MNRVTDVVVTHTTPHNAGLKMKCADSVIKLATFKESAAQEKKKSLEILGNCTVAHKRKECTIGKQNEMKQMIQMRMETAGWLVWRSTMSWKTQKMPFGSHHR